MGSGISGNYIGTLEKSQQYTALYHVDKTMLDLDKKDKDIYNPTNGYFHNPTSTKLENAIENNEIRVNGEVLDGIMTYVINKNGDFIFAKRYNPNNPNKRSPHPTLIGGIDPVVKCAGMVEFIDGKIISINNRSGHFKPNIKSLKEAYKALQKIKEKYPSVFINFEWR